MLMPHGVADVLADLEKSFVCNVNFVVGRNTFIKYF